MSQVGRSIRILLAPLLALMTASAVSADPVPIDPAGDLQLQLGADDSDRMTVPVMVNGRGPYPFVIDTGAERTMISSELAADLGIEPDGTAVIHTISGLHQVALFQIESLDVSGQGVRSIRAPAVPMARLGAIGLLGLDSLHSSRVLFDVHDDVMSVRPATPPEKASKRRRGEDRGVIVITAKSLRGRLIFTEAELNGVPVRVVVDTGAEVTIGNSALRKALKRQQKLGERIDLIGVVGDIMAADLTEMRSLRLQGMTIMGGNIAYSEAPVFAELGLEDQPAILLGMGTIRAFRQVAIDFPNRQVSFFLNPAAGVGPALGLNCGFSRIAGRTC
ncbi:aspartyl protease family protein [Pacificimonas sp. ICDLI1SI03]